MVGVEYSLKLMSFPRTQGFLRLRSPLPQQPIHIALLYLGIQVSKGYVEVPLLKHGRVPTYGSKDLAEVVETIAELLQVQGTGLMTGSVFQNWQPC